MAACIEQISYSLTGDGNEGVESRFFLRERLKGAVGILRNHDDELGISILVVQRVAKDDLLMDSTRSQHVHLQRKPGKCMNNRQYQLASCRIKGIR